MADVLPASRLQRGASSYLSPSPLPRKIAPPTTLVLDTASRFADRKASYYQDSDCEVSSETSSEPSSPRADKSCLDSTPPSSLDQQEHEEEHFFPSYSDRQTTPHLIGGQLPPSPAPTEDDLTSTSLSTPENESFLSSPSLKPADDTMIHDEPWRQVDYLSHEWQEEDIWQSWRHIVSNRKRFGERSRLENASWRTWTKSKYRLRTVSPERLNWLKDIDVTWLYGPFKEARLRERRWISHDDIEPKSEPASQISKNDSFLKKPILKKRSLSEVMLQKSLSSSSLVKQAAAAVQAQRNNYMRRNPHDPSSLSGSTSESVSQAVSFLSTAGPTSMISSQSASGLQSPENGTRRHIRFDDTVEQCIAVDFKEVEEPLRWYSREADASSSSEDDIIMMKQKIRRPGIESDSRRNSIGQESKGIAMLPSTTLKYHHDEPCCPGHPDNVATAAHHGPRLQHSSSQETLRPTRSGANFMINDEDDDISWEPSDAFNTPRSGSAASLYASRENDDDAPEGLKRTASGMFMPDDYDQTYRSTGVLGRVVDTVNTARDIFSVIVNVGWRS